MMAIDVLREMQCGPSVCCHDAVDPEEFEGGHGSTVGRTGGQWKMSKKSNDQRERREGKDRRKRT